MYMLQNSKDRRKSKKSISPLFPPPTIQFLVFFLEVSQNYFILKFLKVVIQFHVDFITLINIYKKYMG